MSLTPFPEPIYVTKPILPDLDALKERLEDTWSSRVLTNVGPRHRELEQRLLGELKVPGLCLFNNGTIGLITACQALRLSGEVITTPFTFPATPHVLAWNGITPVFCDIEPETMNLDPEKIESLITSRTTGILGVHVYGKPCAVDAIDDIAKRHGLRVIYDAAHAFGVEMDGRGIGTCGDISMFSFHATKLFHTIEGGCVTFNDPHLKPRIELLKNFGIKNENEVILPGINGKLNELQCAVGLLNLAELDAERARRQQIENLYRERLGRIPGITLPKQDERIRSSHQYFTIRIDAGRYGITRDELHARLKEFNVVTRKYFFPLCSDYPCYRNLPSSRPELLPVARRTVTEVLVLPMYGQLGLGDVSMICDLIETRCAR